VKKSIDVSIDELQETFDVRKKLDENRIMHFGMLYEAKGEIPPIWITSNMEVVDGRHRIAGAKLAGVKTVPCIIIEGKDRAELIVEALKANMGGALPPTKDDFIVSFTQMIEAGMSRTRIIELMADKLPRSVTRKIVHDVQAMVYKRAVQRAFDAVAQGHMNVVEAAAHFNVEEKGLRTALGGRKKRIVADKFGLDSVTRSMTRRYTSISMSNAKVYGQLAEALEDGEVSPKTVEKVFDKIDGLLERQRKLVEIWRARLLPGKGAKKSEQAGA
jgi:hypothetical protein